MIKGLMDSTAAVLERVLDRASQRQNLISSNIANMDTPGYVPVDLADDARFAQHLALAQTDPGHRSGSGESTRLAYDLSTVPDADGNAVDLDREMAKLASNSGRFDLASRLLAKKMAMLRYSIDSDR